MSSSLRVKPQPTQAKRQKSFAFTDNNGSTSYAFFPEDATTMDIAKAIYKDSGAACWPLTIDGVPLAEFDFGNAEDIIHNVEWSPTQGKIIEKYKKALEKAIEEAKTTHEAAPAMSNVPQPNRGPSRGVEAEQAKGAQSTAPADEDGWKTAHGSKRRHVTRGEESAPRAAPAAQQSQAPSAQAQAANANAPSAQKAVPTKAEAGSKANPAAVPKPTENPWVGKGKASSKVEPADDWRTEEAAKNTKFWLDSNGNWTTDQEKALESSPALTLTDVSGDEDEMPFPEDEEIDVSELEDGDKAKKDIDLNGPREAFSERRAAEIETLFADLIASCLENLDETIAAMTKKKVELLEEKARIEATIAALEKRLEEFKMGAEERVEAVDPYEEDIEALKEHL